MYIPNYKDEKKIFAFSDTHGMHRKLKIPNDVHILLCAGDAVEDNLDPADYQDFLDWFESQPGEYKIFVPGNHELIFDVAPKFGELLFKDRNILLGNNRVIDCDGISFYCIMGGVIPIEGLELIKQTDYFVTHFPIEQLLPDVTIYPNALIFGHNHDLGSAVCINGPCMEYSVSKYEQLFLEDDETYSE